MTPALTSTVTNARTVCRNVLLARELGNDRGDIVTPDYMEKVAHSLCQALPSLTFRVVSNNELLAQGYLMVAGADTGVSDG